MWDEQRAMGDVRWVFIIMENSDTRRAVWECRGIKQTGAAAHGDQARRNPFWRLQELRLPRREKPRPTATRRAATLSGGSKYCACHANRSRGPRRPGAPQGGGCAAADRSRGPRRPGAPQPFLEAPSTAPATQTGAAARRCRNPFWRLQVLRLPRRQKPRPTVIRRLRLPRDQARRNPFWRLQVLRLPRKQEPRPTATRRAATLSGSSKYSACHADRSRGPRRPGAPQPFLEALSTAPATQREAAAHGGRAAMPHRQEPRTSGDQARRNPL